ncbi:MAG: efflux RND transporter permease subunit, partial [Bdellovibrionales bacterium]|nr:efflux RND transporter permease subunit [Bdellovibrionales bacterium]
MDDLYRAPLRVYLIFACLLGAGLWAGSTLSISLFPMSSRPEVVVSINYMSMTPQEFVRTYGSHLEGQLQALNFSGHEVERVKSDYGRTNVRYSILFKWGTPPREAEKETQLVVNSLAATFPQEVRDTIGVWNSGENSGFFALNFFSSERSPDQLYEYLEPILAPRFTKVTDAQFVDLWNPRTQEARIQLKPDRLAAYQLLPKDIHAALAPALKSFNGGRVYLGTEKIDVVLPRQVTRIEDLEQVVVPVPGGHSILLRELADIEITEPTEKRRIIRTNGQQSLMVYAQPRPGGNIKRMSEELLAIIEDVSKTLPRDIQFQSLVDPSVFIRSAIKNVLHEVFLAAGLAVLVLFGFIGNIKNVVTAAIEIPISMILAFILMKWAGINLNLISLAGLALSAGMNVDGSVVVMENIFRHFGKHQGEELSFADRLRIVAAAVSEVRVAVLATTAASLVVFIPLALTSGLTNALLGDLAWAVVFSHGISAFVALILVPVIRLHILRRGPVEEGRAPLEKPLLWVEAKYQVALNRFLSSRRIQVGAILGAAGLLAVSLAVLLPALPKEIIGNPDTDWVGMSIRAPELTQSAQMDSLASEIEGKVLDIFGDRILYTFTQVNQQNSATVMWRLKNKKMMESVLKETENQFPSTPAIQLNVWPWNPSELPIPNPPQLRVEVRGANVAEVMDTTADIQDLI